MQSYLEILPERIRKDLQGVSDAEEIRLRTRRPPGIVCSGRERTVGTIGEPVRQEELTYVLRAASKGSLYTAAESMKQGYITIPGGHRVGICGTAILQDGEIRGIGSVSSLCIRIASQKIGVGEKMYASTLIAGPPGCGKTTYLRDCVRILSTEMDQRVGLADERGELAACLDGVPQLDVGDRTDVLTGCPKALAADMLLRTMNPQWIAVDEITREEDAVALIRGAYCGVKLLATAHVHNREDLQERPVYRYLLRAGVFSQLVLIQPDHTVQRRNL